MARKSLEERFWEKVNKDGPVHPRLGTKCWLWTACTVGSGYGQIGVNGKLRYAHQIAWELTNGPIPGRDGARGTIIRHDCDVRICCNPSHMQLGTQMDNTRDMDERGRRVVRTGDDHWARRMPERICRGERHNSVTKPETVNKGEDHGMHVLTEPQVLAIRKKYAEGGVSYRQLGREYGVDESTIGLIIRRIHWKHI